MVELSGDLPNLRLLFLCARVQTSAEVDEEIRQMLAEGIDWTSFAKKTVWHGLAGLVGHTLIRVGEGLVPKEIANAFTQLIADTRRKNLVLFNELIGVLGTLATSNIQAIPFKGPVLAVESYGDLGLRAYRDLDFLIRDTDLAPVVKLLHGLGYERDKKLTSAQADLVHHLQGQEILFKQSTGVAIEPHTRLTSGKMALNIDYAGLWKRARRATILDHQVLTFAPEDEFIVLAIHGGKEFWWNIKWACDLAAFLNAHKGLNWNIVLERARQQGCLRMVLLAISLADRFFGVAASPEVLSETKADATVEALLKQVETSWESDEAQGPASNKALSLQRLRLHDGWGQKARYVAKTLILPSPEHVAMIALPNAMRAAYVPIKIAHDGVALPLWRGVKWLRRQSTRLRDTLAASSVPLLLMPVGANARRTIAYHRRARTAAMRRVAENPNHLNAWIVLGDAQTGLKCYEEAIESYERALELEPNDRDTWKKRSTAWKALGLDEELPGGGSPPKTAKGWTLRAGFYHAAKNYGEAIEAADRALQLDPSNRAALKIGVHSRLQSCDWSRTDSDMRVIQKGLQEQDPVIVSIDLMSVTNSEADNFAAAKFVARANPQARTLLSHGRIYRHSKPRIAYVSADLHAHATGFLMVELFEKHDRNAFETIAVSLGASDGSEIRSRIERAFDRFIDAQTISNFEVARLLREMEVDVAIDLKGYTAFRRTGIFAHRPAPVQVNYLGFPGTMAAPYIDYIIADHMVIPPENEVHYSEKIAYLPHSYQPNDSRRPTPENPPTRAELGLPENGFVYTCLNNNYKFRPEMFDVWMRLLLGVDGSVLWLLEDSKIATHNLRHEAHLRGVDPARLIFAARTAPSKHLARQRAADLFLDTLPYNAHTTASDALWAGLPVVTCPGGTFPARVAASLLTAMDVPELVAPSLKDYEELALQLARDPQRLDAIRQKIERNRFSAPLFDTVLFARHLEVAYRTMVERYEAGLPPATFSVAR